MTRSLTLVRAGYVGSGDRKNRTDYDSVVVRRPTWSGRRHCARRSLLAPVLASAVWELLGVLDLVDVLLPELLRKVDVDWRQRRLELRLVECIDDRHALGAQIADRSFLVV